MAKKSDSIKPVAERISDVAQRWFLTEPLLFAAYCTHATQENRRLHVPMRCGKGKIEYNPELLKDATDAELADRLKVEVMRILLKHPYQRQPYRARPEILYLASNMTILDSMGGAKSFAFELVPQWLVDELPKGKTFEEYYGLLNRMIKTPPQPSPTGEGAVLSLSVEVSQSSSSNNQTTPSNSNQNSPSPCGEGWGGVLQLAAEAASLWEEDGIMVVDINLRITATLVSAKGRGTLPGSFIEVVEASLIPAINVVNLLKRFKKSVLSQHRNLTRMRPSRRYGFEQMGSRYAYITKVLVAVDVSGSVDSFMLAYMMGMVNHIFKQGIAAIDVVQFDAELKLPVKPLSKMLKKVQVLGRGGTDFQPATDYYLKHHEYDGLIFITDGLAPEPVVPVEAKFSRPVAWIITDDDLVPTIKHGWENLGVYNE